MRYREVAETVQRIVGAGDDVVVVSFDVFDTLVRRRCARAVIHERVGREMVERLAGRGLRSAATPGAARELGVQTLCAAARERGLDGEFHIDDLYDNVLWRAAGNLLSGPERRQLAAELAQFEVDCELSACLPIDGMVDQLRRIRPEVERLVFTSDMYLGERNVRTILDRCGYEGIFDAGYVSGDTKLYKSTGRAFAHVLDREGIAPHQMVHIGDNPIADDEAARALGVRTARIVDRHLDQIRLDEALNRPADLASGIDALRQWTAADDSTATFEESYGRNVLGPIFAAFVHDVADRARRDGVDALYFLSRDGFVLQRIYEIAARSMRGRCPFPPARYLVLSRLPLIRALLVDGEPRKALTSARNQLVPSQRTVLNTMRTLGLDEATVRGVFTRHALDPESHFHDRLLDDPRLADALDDPGLSTEVKSIGESAHALLIRYLDQEGFLDHQRVGLVDIGWGGTIQDHLHDVIGRVDGAPQVFGYYFGGNRSLFDRRTASNRMVPIISSVYTEMNTMSLGNTATFAAIGLIEEAARAPHGTCTGFALEGDVVVPQLKSDADRRGELFAEADLIRLQNGIVDYAASSLVATDLLGISPAMTSSLAHRALQRLVYYPTAAEIRFWKRMTHTNDIGGLFEISERLLPDDEPWWRRPRQWRRKARESMWTHGAARYLLGPPGLLVYNPLWALSYARNVQSDLNLLSREVPLNVPSARRAIPGQEPRRLSATPTSRLYEASKQRCETLGHQAAAAAARSELNSLLATTGTALTLLIARVAPARVRGGVPIVDDASPLSTELGRRAARALATPLLRAEASRLAPARLGARIIRRMLRC